MSVFQVLLQLMAAVMAWTIVCRAVKMDENTREPVRWALTAQGGASFFLAVMPFVFAHWLPWLIVAFVATTLGVQFVTASYWSRGTPKQFER